MAGTVVEQRPVVAGVITVLNTLAFGVGDHQAPTSATFPYTVVYSLDDAERSGPIDDGQADVDHTIQLTTVGETPEQTQLLIDATRTKMKDGTLVVASRKVLKVDLTEGGGVQRDEEEQPPLFYGVDVYSILTTPT